jgi:hypothetical protein
VWGPRLEISACRAWRRLSRCLLDSQASTWLAPRTVLGVAITLLYFAWLLSFLTWGLYGRASLPSTPAYRLWLLGMGTEPSDRCCSVPSYHTGRRYFWSSFWGGAKPLGRASWHGVEHTGRWWTESLMKKHVFTRACLSDVKVIIVIMCVSVVEFLCQETTEWIPVLKYLVSGACGRLWPCIVISGIKCRRFPRSQLLCCLPSTENPWTWLLGARVFLEPRDEADRADRWKNPACPWHLRWGKVLLHISLGFSFFRLVVPPLQPGVVEPYPLQGA